MKVLLFSDVQRKGGAGIAAHRLARALIDQGHDVLWATPNPDAASDIPTANCRDLPVSGRAKRKVSLVLQPGQKQHVEARAIVHGLQPIIRRFQPDIINVHNLHGVNLPATVPAQLSRKVPVVWTLHDMWAFTGTCAYSMGCRQFESACDNTCSMADTYPKAPAHQVPELFGKRIEALRDAGCIAFATPSQWLADEAGRGMLKGHTVRAIPNSVELDRFRPMDRDAARQALDLPLGRPVLITSATTGDPRKGAQVLYSALDKLARPNTILLQLGGGVPESAVGRWDHRVLESIHDPRLLRLAYSAADAHILPTLADNLPNTLLEAAACGVPSIASDIGGVGEAIDPGNTGWLVAPDDGDALAKQIGLVIDEPAAQASDRRRACRTFAESRFAPATQARRYADLFEQTIGQGAGRSTHVTGVSRTGREAA